MKVTIYEPPRTKKNSMQIVKAHGHYILIPSKQYKGYEKACGEYLEGVVDEPISTPVNVKCEFYMPTKRKVDISNLISAVHDVLVHYGVLADDNRDVIGSVDGSRVWYDKDNPRTEITITRYEGEYETWKQK